MKLEPERALSFGKAAEHLVCADLLVSGYTAFLTDQGMPYDVVVDLGHRLVRVQVKSTWRSKNANARGKVPNDVYVFHARRRGKRGASRLQDSDCDVIAFVGLDIKTIAYFHLTEVAQTVSLHPPGYAFRGKFRRSRYASIDGFPFDRIADDLGRI
jgi:hypothetical protein